MCSDNVQFERQRSRSFLLWSCATASCATILLLLSSSNLHAEERTLRPDAPRLQRIVNTLKQKLAIPQTVDVVLVASNPLMMSVEPSDERTSEFRLSIEANFLDVLDAKELEAAIAHELGHVWIFTHHPYLQTEQLANDVAMRVVSRASLERVYQKVWKRSGTSGDLVRFLGSAPDSQPVAGLAAPEATRP